MLAVCETNGETKMNNDKSREILTHSSMQAWRDCRRKFYFSYILGIRKDRTESYFRFGGNFHNGLDLRAQGFSQNYAIQESTASYGDIPAWCNDEETELEWWVEREKVANLLAGYFWRWQNDDIEIIETEQTFSLPIINQSNNEQSQHFRTAGKIDKIVRLRDGRIALMEHKTTSDSIDDNSVYWDRLRIDSQISHYMLNARKMGHELDTILYDVIRKPTIKPKKLTKSQQKIFASQKVWFGVRFDYAEVPQRETPEMYGARLLADIQERPNHYFARREIPRTANDMEEYADELWGISEDIQQAKESGRWYRNTRQCNLMGKCPYADLCFQGVPITDGSVPAGYKHLTNVHPELENCNEQRSESTTPA